jgi:MFS family permease
VSAGSPFGLAGLVLAGMASLAAAMGIGRFAFTPLLPLMQAQDGVTLSQGAWLAAANYLGYLLGSLAAFVWVPRATVSVRWGLLGVAVCTAAMAWAQPMALALALRALAGMASAFVLVGVSARVLGALAAAGRSQLAGWVFAGVGVGIAAVGLAIMGLSAARGAAGWGWLALGLAAGAVCLGGWRWWAEPASPQVQAQTPGLAQAAVTRLRASDRWMVVAYGGLGLGYIIPATFLPAMARARIEDPSVFGWAWPAFGLAAAVSTVVVNRFMGGVHPRRVYAFSVVVMALGVGWPVFSPSLLAIGVAALCVGGTFMVATMAGFQEARRIAPQQAARLIAAMTTSFAVGQLLGPVLVALWAGSADAMRGPSLVAMVVLLASAVVIGWRARGVDAVNP